MKSVFSQTNYKQIQRSRVACVPVFFVVFFFLIMLVQGANRSYAEQIVEEQLPELSCLSGQKITAVSLDNWVKIYGRFIQNNDFYTKDLVQTSDGGYLMTGYAVASLGGIVLVKVDADGNVEWEKAYDISGSGIAYQAIETSDGGFIVVGGGSNNIWVLKLAVDGAIQWQNFYGGGFGIGVQQANDGGYMILGQIGGISNKKMGLLKLSADGQLEWHKVYEGIGMKTGYNIERTVDDAFIVAGVSRVNQGDASVIKVNNTGEIIWQKSFGGKWSDVVYHAQPTLDGGVIAAGRTTSYGSGPYDAWLVKLDSDGNIEWQKRYGADGSDAARHVEEGRDGHLYVTGETNSFVAGYYYDAWILKLSATGDIIWEKSYGVGQSEIGEIIRENEDGTVIVAGYTFSSGSDSADYMLIKMDANGDINGCGIVSNTSATVLNTPAIAQDTTATANVLNTTRVSANGSSYNPALTMQSLCEAEGYFSISGQVVDENGVPVSNVVIMLNSGQMVQTSAVGAYQFDALDDGTYTIVPLFAGFTFSPTSISVSIPPNQVNQNFTAVTTATIPKTYTLFLPTIFSSILFEPITLNGTLIPTRDVTATGEVFHVTTIDVPANLPSGGTFYLSSSASSPSAAAVDDEVDIRLNGVKLFTYTYGQQGLGVQPALVEVPRTVMTQIAGQTVTIQFHDVFGENVSATEIYLIWSP